MFSLTAADLSGRLLGCGDGPASFNATGTALGHQIISADPLYACSAEEIQRRIDETFPTVVEQARQNQSSFVWTDFESVDQLAAARRAAMTEFLADYETGRSAGRYQVAELPALPFADNQFDLTISSHFLFLYSELLSLEFHLQSVLELLRVAREVRIFPLVKLDGTPSAYVAPVCEHLRQLGYEPQIEPVAYEFQRGARHMLRCSY
ncbi:MAG: hypothetical protein U0795_02765 [Pirellulales bacterium]